MKPIEQRSREEIKKVIKDLKNALESAVGVVSACKFAGISEADYEKLARINPEIRELAENADSVLGVKASINIKEAIEEKDLRTSRWYKEKTDPKFSNKVQVDGAVVVSAEDREKAIEEMLEDLHG